MAQTTKQKGIIRRWIKWLESGQYRQGREALVVPAGLDENGNLAATNVDRFCCLGVLCDMAVRAGVINPPFMSLSGKLIYCGSTNSYLPREVQEWAGIASHDGRYKDKDGVEQSLATDNDGRDFSFKKIAKTLRSNPKGLFV